jgi:hypothetical protein
MSKAVPVAAIKNFRRMIQSIRKSCFGSIIRGSSNFWIGSIANGMQKKLYLQTYRAEGFAFVLVILRQLGKELGRRIVLLLFRKRSRIVSFDEWERST